MSESYGRRRFLKGVAASTLMSSVMTRPTVAETWPSRYVRIIVPFAAGGAIDITARLIATHLSQIWGQQVIIENKVGAGGNLGAETAARSDPDGYTIFITAVAFAVNRFLYSSLKYDSVADFAPISLLTLQPNVMVVPLSSPAKTVREFINYAKNNKVTFASSGVGTSMHLCGELFKRMAGIDMIHVPYRGSAQVTSDLIPGRVDVNFDSVSSVWPHIQEGRLRGLALTTTSRIPSAPEMPTISESGIPGFDVAGWVGAFVPSKTPAELAAKIHKDIVAALYQPDVKARLEGLGAVLTGTTPDQLTRHLQSEMDKWGPVIRDAKIRID